MDSKKKQGTQGTGNEKDEAVQAAKDQLVLKQDEKPVDPHFNPFTHTTHVHAQYF